MLTWELPADTKVADIAVVSGDASTLLLVAQSDGRLTLFDIDSGHMTREPLDCHTTRFTVAANSGIQGGPLQFATSAWPEIRLWKISGANVTYQDLPINSDLDSPDCLRFARWGDPGQP